MIYRKRIFLIFGLFIAVLLCCACGSTVSAEDQAIADADVFLQQGNYDEALEKLNSVEAYQKISGKIAEVEAAKAAYEAEEEAKALAARPRKEIELTAENLFDYFYFMEVPSFNSFDELDQIYGLLIFKAELEDRVDCGSAFKIDIGYKATGTAATATYSDGVLTYGDALPGWGGQLFYDEIISITNEDILDPYSHPLYVDDIFHENGLNGCNQWELNIEKVQGKVVLFDD